MTSKLKPIPLAAIINTRVAKRGTKKGKAFEYDLRIDLLGQFIKELRQVRTLTQEQLGELAGVSKSQIAKIENDVKNVRLGTILKVVSALGASINFRIRWD